MRKSALTSVLLVLALVALAGCVPASKTIRLSRLHLPNLSYLSALSALADGTDAPRIAAVVAQNGNTEPQVLVADYNGGLEVIGLDGSGDRSIATDAPCMSQVALTADGLWAACTILLPAGYRVEIVSLSAHGQPVHRVFDLGAGETGMGLAWSPNGIYLAAGIQGPGTGCSVGIFAASPDYSQLTPVGSFTSDALDWYNSCVGTGLAWSPDGTALRLGARQQLAYRLDDHIPLAQMLAAGGSTVTIPAADFVPFSAGVPSLGPVWRPHDTTAVVSVYGGRGGQLLYYTGPDEQPSVLLTMPDAAHQLLDAAWTPDGQQIVLTIGTSPCIDCGTRVLPDVYLFTPTLPS